MQRTTPTRSYRSRTVRSLRNRVAQAFRALAVGVAEKPAYAHTIAFYRAGAREWAKQLG